jgi:Raf kinase inhibitor-like YbhB/YbcL family protein
MDAGPVQDAGGADRRDSGGGGDGSTTTIALTSSAFTDGAMIPAVSTCAGANTSPDLSWTAGPAQTMSYAIVLTDMSNQLVHWVLWDIPTATMSLPAALPGTATLTSPAGAKQVHVNGTGNGYYGPCPMGQTHTYQFRVHAVDVATLPTVTTTSSTTTVRDQVMMHSIAHGDLSGTSNAQSM